MEDVDLLGKETAVIKQRRRNMVYLEVEIQPAGFNQMACSNSGDEGESNPNDGPVSSLGMSWCHTLHSFLFLFHSHWGLSCLGYTCAL